MFFFFCFLFCNLLFVLLLFQKRLFHVFFFFSFSFHFSIRDFDNGIVGITFLLVENDVFGRVS